MNTSEASGWLEYVEIVATDPFIPAGRLSVEQRLPRSLDRDRFVSTAAAVSALGAVTVPPISDRHEDKNKED